MSKRKSIVFTFIISILILILLAIGGSTFYASYIKSKIVLPPTVTEVSVIEVTEGAFVGNIKASGFVNASASGNLFTQASGKISKIFVKPGEKVKKKQVILSLDTEAEESAIKALKANLNVLRLNYEGLLSVYKSGGTSKVSVEQARASYNQLLAQVKSNEENLDKKKIFAPYDGVIGSISVSIGDIVQGGKTIVTINPLSSNASSYSNIAVSPDLISEISTGNKVEVYDDNGKVIAVGSVEAIDPTISSLTGLAKIRATFNEQNLNSGQFIKVKISTNTLFDKIVIPDIAISYTLYGQTVYKVIPLTLADYSSLEPAIKSNPELSKEEFLNNLYKVKEVFIKSSQRINDVALITDGLKVGDVIITNGDVLDGSYVRVNAGYGLGISKDFSLPPYAQKK